MVMLNAAEPRGGCLTERPAGPPPTQFHPPAPALASRERAPAV